MKKDALCSHSYAIYTVTKLLFEDDWMLMLTTNANEPNLDPLLSAIYIPKLNFD